MSWLAPVHAALDTRLGPVTVFFRDDDGGWDTPALIRLVDRFARVHVPVDLAVIPAELDAQLAEQLLAWHRAGIVGIHQHGYGHHNRESVGRKCEFGSTRPIGRMAADIFRGRHRLHELLGDAADPIFTPPWNRCVDDIAELLADAGFLALSRDTSAATIGYRRIREIPISVDWFGRTKGTPWDRPELGRRIAVELLGEGPVGIMLHHAVMDHDDLDHLTDLLELLVLHQMAATRFMRDLIDVAPRLGADARPGGT